MDVEGFVVSVLQVFDVVDVNHAVKGRGDDVV